ncbi:Pvc16 family protein [Kribbella sp. NPDC055071]
MLDELGTAIGSRLGEVLPSGTTVSLEPPDQTWKDRVSLFLYQVLENQDAASAGLWTEERDADGRVVSRTAPERRYDFCFLVTAWAGSVELEFGLLGNILRSVAHAPLIAEDQLTGSLARARGPVTLSIGRPGSRSVQPEIWSALGLPARACLDLVVTAPVPSDVEADVAPPPDTIDLGVAAPGNTANPRPSGTQRRPAARITEGALDGQARSQAG